MDESVVFVCIHHTPCGYVGRGVPPADCKFLWIYGVGAAVFELDRDLQDLRDRLNEVREVILHEVGIESAPRLPVFVKEGWHATKDGPEFSVPFVKEIERGAGFKGHVRYAVFEDRLDDVRKTFVFDGLFVRMLASLRDRYRGHELDLVFERDQSKRTRYTEIVRRAGFEPSQINYCDEPKGDPALAVADYLLFASLKFMSTRSARCADASCSTVHRAPIARELSYDDQGRVVMEGHLDAGSHAYRLYQTFAKHMSSLVPARFEAW